MKPPDLFFVGFLCGQFHGAVSWPTFEPLSRSCSQDLNTHYLKIIFFVRKITSLQAFDFPHVGIISLFPRTRGDYSNVVRARSYTHTVGAKKEAPGLQVCMWCL